MKNDLISRLLMIVSILSITVLLSACGGAPDDVIKKAIRNTDGHLKSGWRMTSYEITNSYERDVGGETVHFYEYSGETELIGRNLVGTLTDNVHITGTVALVQRGDEWYLIN